MCDALKTEDKLGAVLVQVMFEHSYSTLNSVSWLIQGSF